MTKDSNETATSFDPGTTLIVDNADAKWKVREYLKEWTDLANRFDIATGYFDIGALLALDNRWQKLDHIRILMGDEVSLKTKNVFAQGLRKITAQLDASLEKEKIQNDFLAGVPSIVDAIRSGKIQCRVYRRDKFHAKCYITHGRSAVMGPFALVGSSNFTYPGLVDNVELNVQIRGGDVRALQDWYEHYWDLSEDVTPEILRVIERHVHPYTPFEVYAKALQEFFRGHEMSADEWELSETARGSRIYKMLDQYQKEGYHNLLKIARRFGGAFLCDGVGLGKTFVGLMLIERLTIHENRNVVLFAPKAALESVWKPLLRELLPHLGGTTGIFNNLVLFGHTDLGREGDFPDMFARVAEKAHAVIIDEAHHFRNLGTRGAELSMEDAEATGRIRGEGRVKPSRYWRLFDLIGPDEQAKTVYMLTATPINNELSDLRHMIDLFARRNDRHFEEQLGVHSLIGHFRKMERDLAKALAEEDDSLVETNMAEAQRFLVDDTLFKALVVQRSRAYAKQSQLKHGATAANFPERTPPQVCEYGLKKTYGKVLDMVESAFHKDKPLFSLAIYYPLAFLRDESQVDPFAENRQKQVVGLIRTGFLKRIESSVCAFERSCERLMLKLLAFAKRHSESKSEKSRLERWMNQHGDLVGYVRDRQLELMGEGEDVEEDIISPEMLEAVEELDRDIYKVEEMLTETILDLDQIAKFLDELRKFKPSHDDKLKSLTRLLKNDSVLKTHKVLVFTEFADTAEYLQSELKKARIEGIETVHGGKSGQKLDSIRRFAPYYNGSNSAEAEAAGGEIRVLISTDVLSEGLNLQDCTRLINYDIHWNPVRLMQRIGRVDRRMSPTVEAQLVADHPEQKKLRGKIAYWNFLPPAELDQLLELYGRVAHKTLRISKTLGIEGRKLLTPDDDYDALREFNEQYEGTTTPTEAMHLEYQDLLAVNAGLEERLSKFPGRVFSGKKHPSKKAQGVFFCFALPRPDHEAERLDGEIPWTEAAGETKWYLYDLKSGEILDEPSEIVEVIRSTSETPRECKMAPETLSEIRGKLEKHIKNTFLKTMQAPVGVKPVLKAWMELN